MKEKYPQISVVFGLVGKEMKLELITNTLAISPTSTRTPEDWPEALKIQADNLPIELRPRFEWTIEVKKECCKVLSEVVLELLDELQGKENMINELCEQTGIASFFTIIIHMEYGSPPEIVLTKEITSFATKINAEIGFDIYTYSDEEVESRLEDLDKMEFKQENTICPKELEEFRAWKKEQDELDSFGF